MSLRTRRAIFIPVGIWVAGVVIGSVWAKLSPGTEAPTAVIAVTSGVAGGCLVELLSSPRRHSLSGMTLLGSMALLGLFRWWKGDSGGLLVFLMFTGLGAGLALARYCCRAV